MMTAKEAREKVTPKINKAIQAEWETIEGQIALAVEMGEESIIVSPLRQENVNSLRKLGYYYHGDRNTHRISW